MKERTLQFGVDTMKVLAALPHDPRGWTIGKQLARCATSIGANVWEANAAHTDSEFANKISIARKEAHETQYWLEFVRRLELLAVSTLDHLATEVDELTKVLGTIVRKTQEHISRG